MAHTIFLLENTIPVVFHVTENHGPQSCIPSVFCYLSDTSRVLYTLHSFLAILPSCCSLNTSVLTFVVAAAWIALSQITTLLTLVPLSGLLWDATFSGRPTLAVLKLQTLFQALFSPGAEHSTLSLLLTDLSYLWSLSINKLKNWV